MKKKKLTFPNYLSHYELIRLYRLNPDDEYILREFAKFEQMLAFCVDQYANIEALNYEESLECPLEVAIGILMLLH